MDGALTSSLSKNKRKKKEDEDEVVTYINERNKVFNKKIARYYDKYTKEWVPLSFRQENSIDGQNTRQLRTWDGTVAYLFISPLCFGVRTMR